MKTFYSAFTCQGNVGDILINKYQIEEYAKYGEVYVDCTGMPEYFTKILLTSENPNIKDFVASYGLHYRGIGMFRVLRLLQQEGFTHFTRSPGPYPYITFPIKTCIMRLVGAIGYYTANRLGMKVFALGIDLDYQMASKILFPLNKKYFSVYHLLGVRSKANYHRFAGYMQNVKYCPDMAFLCPDYTGTKSVKTRNKIALSFRRVEDVPSLVKNLEKICMFFFDNGYGIDLVYQVEEDYVFCEELKKQLPSGIIFNEEMIGFEKLNTYTAYSYVITNRLHVALMGALHGALPYAIISRSSKELKIRNLFDSIYSIRIWSYIDRFDLSMLEDIFRKHNLVLDRLFTDLNTQKRLCLDTIATIYQ